MPEDDDALDLSIEEDVSEEMQDETEGKSKARKGWDKYEQLTKRLPKIEEKARKEGFEQARKEFERSTKAAEVFGELGFPKMASMFLSQNPETEVTAETGKTFLDSLGLSSQSAEPKPVVQEEEAKGFHAGGGEPVDEKRRTRAEIDAKVQAGRMTAAQAMALFNEGKVELANQQVAEDVQRRLQGLR